jgi:putative FmdB family regulatory protein
MPLYEYECRQCGIQFTRLQRFGAPPPEVCPNGHKQVHRLLSEPAIIFKGSGFYVTDHPQNGRRATSGTRRERDKEPASDSSTKTDKTTERD